MTAGEAPPAWERGSSSLLRWHRQAIYRLQHSHRLHRTLSSPLILFFYDPESSELHIDVLSLAGLLHSRPDDQRVDDSVFEIISEGKVVGRRPSDIYMHLE